MDRLLQNRVLASLGAVRDINGGFVATSQATSATTYGDLATVGPTVSLITGTSALVLITGVGLDDGNLGNDAYMSWAVSGATTVAASDTWAWYVNQGLNVAQAAACYIITTLNPGLNTFTAKYRKAGGTSTASFYNRGLWVIAL